MKKDLSCILLIVALALPLLLINLSKAPVENWDEATNILVVDETRKTSTPWDLQFQNNPFFEKPPLWYFSTQVVVKVSGSSLISYRFISVVASIGVLIALYFIGKRLRSRLTGLIAAGIFLSTPHLSIVNAYTFSSHTMRSADLDMLQILFIVLGLLAVLSGHQNRHAVTPEGPARLPDRQACLSGRQAILVYFFSALAFLTKGPFGLLPIVICIGEHIFHKKFSRKVIIHHGIGITILVLLTIPWYWYQTATHGNDFISNHVYYHIFGRATTMLEGHEQPWFYYLKLLTHRASGYFVPLTIIALLSLMWKNGKSMLITPRVWIIIWTFFLILIVLTLLQTKLSWYAFYLYPLISALCAWVCTLGRGVITRILLSWAIVLSIFWYSNSLLYVLRIEARGNYCELDSSDRDQERSRKAYEVLYGECD